MIGLLSRWFIRDRDNVTDPRVRRAYGQLCGLVGIGLNLLLFAGKLFAGAVSGSVAITADAFNNLSDAGSSVVTLLGFRLAGKSQIPIILRPRAAGIRLRSHRGGPHSSDGRGAGQNVGGEDPPSVGGGFQRGRPGDPGGVHLRKAVYVPV